MIELVSYVTLAIALLNASMTIAFYVMVLGLVRSVFQQR